MLVVALGPALGYRPGSGVAGICLAIALTVAFAWALSWVFTLPGLLLRSPNAIMSLAMVVLFPLTLASNTFVDPATMPGWLRDLVNANPVSHLVTAVRAAMNGHYCQPGGHRPAHRRRYHCRPRAPDHARLQPQADPESGNHHSPTVRPVRACGDPWRAAASRSSAYDFTAPVVANPDLLPYCPSPSAPATHGAADDRDRRLPPMAWQMVGVRGGSC
jgi:hypothetical protein